MNTDQNDEEVLLRDYREYLEELRQTHHSVELIVNWRAEILRLRKLGRHPSAPAILEMERKKLRPQNYYNPNGVMLSC